MTDFVARLIEIRLGHTALRSRRFMHGQVEPAPGIKDISWFDQRGEPMTVEAWNNMDERVLTLRRADREGDRLNVLTLFLNPTGEAVTFRLPPPGLPAAHPRRHQRPDRRPSAILKPRWSRSPGTARSLALSLRDASAPGY